MLGGLDLKKKLKHNCKNNIFHISEGFSEGFQSSQLGYKSLSKLNINICSICIIFAENIYIFQGM